MRKALAILFCLLSAISAAGTAVCVYYLPSSLREWWGEPKDMALLILGTIAVAFLCGLSLRGAFLGFGMVISRKLLDQMCTGLFALFSVTFLVLSVVDAVHAWPGVVLSITFLACALAFRWVSKAPAVNA